MGKRASNMSLRLQLPLDDSLSSYLLCGDSGMYLTKGHGELCWAMSKILLRMLLWRSIESRGNSQTLEPGWRVLE
jgi:hypothetical protein